MGNTMLFWAAIIASFVIFGHLLYGYSTFIMPMSRKLSDRSHQAMLNMIYHYITVFMILSAIELWVVALGVVDISAFWPLTLFIGANYILFGIVQIGLSIYYRLQRPLARMFQWIFFFLIGLLIFFAEY